MMWALIEKDVKLFFRNQFLAVITLLGLTAFTAMYYLMPSKPDDSLPAALYLQPDVGAEMRAFLSDALDADLMESEEQMLQNMREGDYTVGLSLTQAMLDAMAAGEELTIPVYSAPGATPDLKQAILDIFTAGLNNLHISSLKKQINVEDRVIVLGPDLMGIGEPIALRDRMLPLLLMMVFSIELIGLANLISEEMTRGTANAILVTPLKTGQFFRAKMVMGIGLAFVEVCLLAAVTGKLMISPAILVATLLIGSLLVSGIAFFIAAFASGLMSVMAWSMLFLLILLLPGMAVMFPSMTSGWICMIPSHYLVDTLHRALNYGAGWNDVAANLAVLLASGLAFLATGILLLRRKFR